MLQSQKVNRSNNFENQKNESKRIMQQKKLANFNLGVPLVFEDNQLP